MTIPPGLSPRVRGSQCGQDQRGDVAGPIPAGAGEPSSGTGERDLHRAYPRGCGGAPADAVYRPCAAGLSPRVRGSHSDDPENFAGIGPIPAGAGEPGLDFAVVDRPGAYPRGCGGACATEWTDAQPTGLSPRVRGSRDPIPLGFAGGGPIPAGAGEPRSS